MRASGDTVACVRFAQGAWFNALQEGDGETAWQAKTCVGRMHRWRGEHEEALQQFREALRHAEEWVLAARARKRLAAERAVAA
jgi:hypothetical protein